MFSRAVGLGDGHRVVVGERCESVVRALPQPSVAARWCSAPPEGDRRTSVGVENVVMSSMATVSPCAQGSVAGC